MRSLKILVVVMGVMLVAGIVGLAFAVSYRLNHPRPSPTVVPAGPAAPTAGPGAATVIDLPPGAKVLGTETSADRLVVRVGLAAGEELLIFNLGTGAPIATIDLKPADQKPAP
jgi:hypothetical protein